MTRKLLKLFFAGFFLVPLGAFGLGLGQINVQSVLNQPLNAQIELLSATQDEFSTISVDLASPQVFAQAGIDRPALLSGLQFTLQAGPNSNSYIQVSSKQPIREPLLNFLVEVDWPQGRLVREFVVLLEPPDTAVRRSAPAPAPVRSTPPRPVESLPQKVLPSTSPATPWAPGQLSGEIYGPVAQGETLWSIANRLRPNTSISMQAVMRSIVQANPHAFINGDGNRLLAGTTLQVPAYEEPAGRPAPETALERSESSAPQLAAELPNQQQPSVRLIASESEEVPEQIPVTMQAIDSAAQAPGGATLSFPSPFVIGLEDGHPELRVAKLEDLRARIDALVGVDDAALSAVQAGEAKISQPEQQEAVPKERTLEVSEAAFVVPDSSIASADEAEPTSVQAAASEKVDATAPTGIGLEPAPQGFATSAEIAQPVPAREPGIMDRLRSLRNNPLLPVWVAFGLLLLTALVVLLARGLGKKSAKEQEEENEEMDFEPIVAPSQPTAAAAAAEIPLSLVKEAKPQTAAMPPRSPVSPLERVDLLLAVGNYREAENTVQTALDENPNDTALALKLLDVHYAANNTQRFQEGVEMLRGRLVDDADLRWEHVKRMGRELCPGHPLFAERENLEVAETDENLKETVSLQPKQLKKTSHADSEEDFSIPGENETSMQPFSDLGREHSTPKTPKHPAAKSEEPAELRDLDAELEALGFDFDDHAEGRSEKVMEVKGSELGAKERSDVLEAELKDLNFDFDQIAVEKRGVEEEFKLPCPERGVDGEIGETMEGIGSDDDVETKLDLAVAYIDMDDHIGARSLLDEVLQEGNSDQKKRAEELLRKLS